MARSSHFEFGQSSTWWEVNYFIGLYIVMCPKIASACTIDRNRDQKEQERDENVEGGNLR